MKHCTRCLRELPVTNFGRHPTARDRLHPHCRECRSVDAKEDRSRRGAEINARRREKHRLNPERKRALEKAWRTANPEKVKQGKAEHYQRNKETIKAKTAAYRAANPDVKLRAHLKKMYGLTLEDFRAMAIEQQGLCAICRQPPGIKGLCVDHNHATGRVRGLLCGHCNLGLGAFRDRTELLVQARRYLLEDGVPHDSYHRLHSSP